MKLKVMKKDRIITCGSGDYRAILDQDSKIAYAYTNPEHVLAVYSEELKAWVTPERPYYSTGGWGSGSNGDAIGYHLITNIRDILRGLGVGFYTVNTKKHFLTNEQVIEFNRDTQKANDAIQILNDRIKKLDQQDVDKEKYYPTISKKMPIELTWNNGSRGLGQDVFKVLANFERITNMFLDRKFKAKAMTLDSYTFTPKNITQNGDVVAFWNKADLLIMNSQTLRTTLFEDKFLGGESIVQKLIREKSSVNIPFNVLRAGDLKLEQTSIIDSGPAETFNLNGNERHFTGALLLENAGRKFLMDIDRIEIKHGIFNAFFVEVKSSVRTISEAYISMKPDEVIEAEKAGIEVLRQGEWFFIETGLELELTVNRIIDNLWNPQNAPKDDYLLRSSISHGKGRPNTLHVLNSKNEKLNGLVSGIVSHTGREHRDLVLCREFEKHKKSNRYDSKPDEKIKVKLWKVIGNTTVSNFQITGDID